MLAPASINARLDFFGYMCFFETSRPPPWPAKLELYRSTFLSHIMKLLKYDYTCIENLGNHKFYNLILDIRSVFWYVRVRIC
jgi:hypothetical protein